MIVRGEEKVSVLLIPCCGLQHPPLILAVFTGFGNTYQVVSMTGCPPIVPLATGRNPRGPQRLGKGDGRTVWM